MSSSSTPSFQERFFEAVSRGDLSSAQTLVKEIKKKPQKKINSVDNRGWTALHVASHKGHTSIVQWLLSNSGGRARGFNSVLARAHTGFTALHNACRKGHLECVEALVEGSKIENGEREKLINAVTAKGWTALHHASHKGHLSIIRWILSDAGGRAAGFRTVLVATRGKHTALHLACQEGHLECVQALVEGNKIDNDERKKLLNAADDEGSTVLHYATSNGHASLIRWLLSDSGGRAAGFRSLLITASFGETALHRACREGRLECAQALVEGSKVEDGEREELINAVDKHGFTVLHLATCKGHALIVRWLVSDSGGRAAGFNSLLVKAETGVTALHFACEKNHLECLQALVEGSKIDNGEREELVNTVNEDEWTALHFAADHGHSSIVQWILSDSGGRAAGFNSPLSTTNQGFTAFHLACQNGFLDCVQALVEGSKIDNDERAVLVNAVTKKGYTALHFAVFKGHAAIIRWLLSDSGGRSAGFNSLLARDSSGFAVLHFACQEGHLECIQALVEGSRIDNGEREALLNAITNNECTALHYAVYRERITIVQWLLSETGGRYAGLKSSTITAKTNRSESALRLALQSQSTDNLRTLLSGCTSAERMNLFLCVDEHGWTALHLAARYRQLNSIREFLHYPETQMIVDRRDHRGMTALHRVVICGIDDKSRREWHVEIFRLPSREEIVAALLTTPSSTATSQQQAAQVDPNVGLKFD